MRAREKGRLLTSIMDLMVHLAKRFKDCVERAVLYANVRGRDNAYCGVLALWRFVSVVYFQSSPDRPGERIVERSQ